MSIKSKTYGSKFYHPNMDPKNWKESKPKKEVYPTLDEIEECREELEAEVKTAEEALKDAEKKYYELRDKHEDICRDYNSTEYDKRKAEIKAEIAHSRYLMAEYEFEKLKFMLNGKPSYMLSERALNELRRDLRDLETE